jgi:hypothetical protein
LGSCHAGVCQDEHAQASRHVRDTHWAPLGKRATPYAEPELGPSCVVFPAHQRVHRADDDHVAER